MRSPDICAVGEVYECEAVNGCKRTSTDAINLSEFIIVDTDKKQMTSASLGEKTPTTEDIEGLTATDKNVLIYGTQGADTWNATISLETGGLPPVLRAAPHPSRSSAAARRNSFERFLQKTVMAGLIQAIHVLPVT